MQSTKQAIFMVGDDEYGLDILEVSSIEKVIPIRKVIGFTNNLKGIINLRGELIPVYSLRRRFGMVDIPSDDDTRFIISSSEGIVIAYEVDKMKEILEIEAEQLYITPSIVENENTRYIKCISRIDDRLAIILDSGKILTDEEQNEIKSIIESAKKS